MSYQLPVDYSALEWWERRDVRQQYIREQDGKCQHCGEPLSGEPSRRVNRAKINWRLFPKTFQKYPIHLHHSHDTGLTIGAVHMRCNAYLWQYEGE